MAEPMFDYGKDLQRAYDDGYATGWAEAEADMLSCGDETPTTNADRIRSMTDEELAEFMGELPCCPPGADVKELCYPMDSCEGTDLQVKCWRYWLKSPAKEGET